MRLERHKATKCGMTVYSSLLVPYAGSRVGCENGPRQGLAYL